MKLCECGCGQEVREGEGEQTILEVVKAIENNNSFGNIKGSI